jgi:acyl carrier protein
MTNNNSAIITDKIRSYVLEETFADGGKIKNDSLIFREGYFDSMGFVRLVSFIENEFGIRITDEDLVEKNFESVNAISSFVLSRLN